MFPSLSLLAVIINLNLSYIVIFILTTFLGVSKIIVEKNKQFNEKNKRILTTKQIIDNIHKNFNISNIKEISVQNIGKILDADRCFIAEYDTLSKKFSKVNSEYLSSDAVESLKGDLPSIQATRVTNICISNKILNVANAPKYVEENHLTDTLIDIFYKKYLIKSVLALPIRHSGKVLGAIVLHYTRKFKTFSEEDIKFVWEIADSIGLAIYQSELYETQSKIAKKESILRKISETIRLTLDSKEMKQNIVNEIGKIFGADRCYLRAYNQVEGLFLKPEVEYLASEEITSLKDVEPDQKGLSYFFEEAKLHKGFMPVEVTQHFFDDNLLKNSDLQRYFKNSGIKTDFAVPVWDKKNRLTFLVLHYIKEKINFTEDDKELLISMAKQVSIALEQSSLYEETKIKAERETITRKTIELIRNSLEIEDILRSVATQLINSIKNVDRVFVGEVLFRQKKNFVELIKDSDIKKFSEVEYETYLIASDYWEKHLKKNKRGKIINNILESDMPKEVKQVYFNMGVKSICVIPVQSQETEAWGGLFLSSVKTQKNWDEDELIFLESIASQLDVAIKQAELFKLKQQTAEREALLREIIEAIRNSVDINKIFTTVCTEITKVFNVQRVSIVEFYDKKDYSKWNVKKEYRTRDDIIGLNSNYDNKAGTFNGHVVARDGKNLVIDNLEEANVPDFYKETYRKMGAKSILSVPVKREEDTYGLIFLVSVDNYRQWKPEEILLLESIASQLYVAIRQAELFNIQKRNARKERMLREIIEMIRQSLNINEIIRNSVNETGKLIGAKRVFFSKYDAEKNIFLPPGPQDEYLASKNLPSYTNLKKSLDNYFPFLCQHLKETKKTIVITDIAKFIEENNLKGSIEETSFQIDNDGTSIIIPIIYNQQFLGGFVFDYYPDKKLISEDINFLETIAEQVAIGLVQAELYKKQFQIAQREKTLRELINMIRESLDINEIIHNLVNETGKMFKFKRAFFCQYDKNKNIFLAPQSMQEYYINLDDKSYSNSNTDFSELYSFISQELSSSRKILFFNDREEFIKENNLDNTPDAFNLRIENIGTVLCIPIIYEDDLLGCYVCSHKEPYSITKEIVEYLETIAEQISIALYQAELLQKEKESAEREQALRRIVNVIRSSLDIQEIKKRFVLEAGKYFNADRCFIYEYGENIKSGIYIEYTSSPEIKKMSEDNFSKPQFKFWEEAMFLKDLKTGTITSDLEKYIIENNLQGTFVDEHRRNYNIKSAIGIPIIYADRLYGSLIIQYTQKIISITEQDEKFHRILADQAAIALYQSELLETKNKALEREIVLKQITEKIRSNLDINQRKKDIADTMGKYFKADRCIILENDPKTGRLMVVDKYSEYTSTPEIKSYIGTDFGEASNSYITEMHKKMKEVELIDTKNFIKENKLEGTFDEKFLIESETKSAFGLSLFYQDNFLGILSLNFTKSIKILSDEDKNLLRILSTQIANALHQSSMYEIQKKAAHKERVLKDIISDIKLTRDLNQAYNMLLKKLSDIFNLNRTLFLESSKINPDELDIKYEYVIEREDLAVNNIIFPQVCIDEFLKLIHDLQPLVIDDVMQCHPTETIKFFRKYKIQALMSVPLVKYNGETKVLGFIVLCAEHIRNWTEEEIDLIKAISDSVVSVIWEISKFIETEELRNSFILTLAHDFQVPLVGERTAIEYLLNYSDCSTGTSREILQEILENNRNISTLLEKSVDIYNYEAGKKILEFDHVRVSSLVNEAVSIKKSEASLKGIKIKIRQEKDTYFIKADKKELIKVLSVLIENAIMHSLAENDVVIDYYKKTNRIIISIHNMGKPIPEDIQVKLFNRYEMALAIERKIGAGTGLFLSKRIIEAHKGYIWFETNEKEGTTFYVSMPSD